MLKKVSKQLYLSILLICSIVVLNGCESRNNHNKASEEKGVYLFSEDISYATGFSIDYYKEYTKVTINNPWVDNQEPYKVYYLLKNDSIDIPDDGIKIKTPITSIAVNTFSYFEFLSLIGELGTVTGVTDGFRIYNPAVLEKIKNKQITDLGDPFNPNIEKTIALNPQAIISSAYAQMDNYSIRLNQTGFPVIYSLEWMENSPLARAEWIKMIAAFFDKKSLADSIFNDIENRYLEVKEIAKKIEQRRTIMTGDIFQGTWYVPGGNSFNAALYRDAGLSYQYESNNLSGSIGLDIESILTQFSNTDQWFGCQADSYAELTAKDSKYLLMQSVKQRQVFNNHNRTTPSGGNDYFESAIAHPDMMLSDLVKAAYPHLLPDHSFTYIKPLN